jgi:outer membrane protein
MVRASLGHRLRRLSQTFFAIVAVSLSAASVYADAVGVRFGAYRWQPDFDGTVRSGGEKVDIHRDLGLSDDDADVIFVAIEHPIPLLPNVLVQQTHLDTKATKQLTRTFTFDDTTYTGTDTVKTDLDLSHTDATFYYELLDNWAELNVGLTVRHFDNGVKIRAINNGKSSKIDLNATLPMLYAAAKFNLPLTGVYVAVDGNGIGYSGSTLFDYRAMLGYESPIGLGAEIGVRNFDLNYKDGDEKADVKVDGAYAQVFYHF